jgi:hypothetical protein
LKDCWEEPSKDDIEEIEDNNPIYELIDECDNNDHDTSEDIPLLKDTDTENSIEQSLGLRQRRNVQSNRNSVTTTKTTKQPLTTKTTMKTTAAANEHECIDTTGNNNTTSQKQNNNKKENLMDTAQQNMIQALKYYVHAATLIASIQQEIKNHQDRNIDKNK